MKWSEHVDMNTRKFFIKNFYQFDKKAFSVPKKFEDIKTNSELGFLELDLDVPYEKIAKEIPTIEEMFVEHANPLGHHSKTDQGYHTNYAYGWKALCIHGLDPEKTGHFPNYGYPEDMNEENIPHRWTEVADKCPETTQWLKSLPFEAYKRVRFMLIEPNGYLMPHIDTQRRGFFPINIAITHPEDCYMVMEPFGIVPFSPGKSFWMDTSYKHAVVNFSDQPRVHIIINGWYKMPEFQKMIMKNTANYA